VSRPTVRGALHTLEEDGYLRRVRGSGTFVTHRPRLKNNIELNFGVSELIRSMGMRPGTESLKVFDGKPTVEEIRLLELSPDTPVVVVERVRTADGTPVVFSRDMLPRFLLEGCGDIAQRLAQGIHLSRPRRPARGGGPGRCHHHPGAGGQPARHRPAHPAGTLLVYLRQVDYMAEGRPVMLSHEHHLASAFEITARRKGPRLRKGGGQVIELIFRLTRDDVAVDHALRVYDAPVVRALSDAVAAQVNRRPSLCGLGTWDDTASLIHEAGIPAVPCGPGSDYRAHAADEHVPIEQLLDCAQALARGARNWLHQTAQ
jgi:GntR family transcriptional regulator